MDELYKQIGKISYAYSRTDFLLSNIAFDFGIAETPYNFFANGNFEKKVSRFKEAIDNSVKDKALARRFNDWLVTLDDLRKKRNSILHSIVLGNASDANDLIFYNYRFDKAGLQRDFGRYTIDDLKALSQTFVDTHNAGYLLWEEYKKKNGMQHC